ncbi:MAG: inorganic phosphate transporter [Elusimicrobia bacterium]|nr:inorganic phosphate transporter [Elusimicrobiota bacterium]
MSVYFLAAAALAGFYMAWNIGANDSANSMASAVGAKAITFKQAIIIAGVVEFLGAYLVGSHVTQTIRKGVISPSGFASPVVFAYALFAAVLGAAVWVFIATWKELPVSTTHSIVGAIVGVGIVSGGTSSVEWGKVVSIVLSWIISPVGAGLCAFFLFRLINKHFIIPEDRDGKTRKYFPVFIFVTFFIIGLSFLLKTPFGKRLHLGFPASLIFAVGFSFLLTAVISLIMLKTLGNFHPENVFRILQIMTSCYVAFAHGSNDVANAIGPLAGIFSVYKTGLLPHTAEIPDFILILGGLGISLGIFTWGYKVIKTVGYSITELTNTRGFAIDFYTATVVLLCSKLGLPVSTTHAAVGAILGIGFARGLDAVDLRVVKNIVYAWVLTLPASALLSSAIFIIVKGGN